MTLARAVDVAIGLLLVVLIVSLASSGVTEAIARMVGKRSKGLWDAIHTLINAPAIKTATDRRPGSDEANADVTPMARSLYDSPFLNEFRKRDRNGRTLISNVSASEFTRGLMWAATDGTTTTENALTKLAQKLPAAAPAAEALKELTIEGAASVEDALKGLGDWYDAQMARVSQEYRRWSKVVALVVGLAIAVAANIDLLFVARALNGSDALRAAAVANANTLVKTCSSKTGDALSSCLQDQSKGIVTGSNAVQLPVGWANDANRDFDGWNKLWKALGWALTGLAAMQGGPFWFDLLRRLLGLRPAP
jgi:hypothetical protein